MRIPFPVVLASGSPRRRELLASLISEFEILVPGIDEDALIQPDPAETVTGLATAKAYAVQPLRPGALILAADTVVCLGSAILNKPRDDAEAKEMLRSLSGNTHRVLTGVCLTWPFGEVSFWDETTVRFLPVSDDDIAAYVASGEPMDKAGAYAIQGGAQRFVHSIEGSLTNVIGLPMEGLTSAIETLRVD